MKTLAQVVDLLSVPDTSSTPNPSISPGVVGEGYRDFVLQNIWNFSVMGLLGRNSKFCSGEDTPGCLEVLHAEFHDAQTSNTKDKTDPTDNEIY